MSSKARPKLSLRRLAMFVSGLEAAYVRGSCNGTGSLSTDVTVSGFAGESLSEGLMKSQSLNQGGQIDPKHC